MPLGVRHLGRHFVLAALIFQLTEELSVVEGACSIRRPFVKKPRVLHLDGEADGEESCALGEVVDECSKDCSTIRLELSLSAQILHRVCKV